MTRNEILNAILSKYHGAPDATDSQNDILKKIVVASGGTITSTTRNGLLNDCLIALGGTPSHEIRNKILEDILAAQIIAAPVNADRNTLLTLWLSGALVETYFLTDATGNKLTTNAGDYLVQG